MLARQSVPAIVTARAAQQAGAVSRRQLLDLGVGDHLPQRLLRQGHWQTLLPGVYATEAPVWATYAWAGVLSAAGRGVLGGECAAHLWGWRPQPEEIEVWYPTTLRSRGPWRFREGERRSRGMPDRTTREDTVLDLWPRLSSGDRYALLGKAVSDGLSVNVLRGAAQARSRLGGRTELTAMLGDVAEGANSVLERLYLNSVERAHGLPRAIRQRRRGRRIVDCEYDGYSLIVELDGRHGHQGADRFRDMSRDNAHLVSGLSTLRYGYDDVKNRPCAVAFQVAEVLIQRGWHGYPSSCPSCCR